MAVLPRAERIKPTSERVLHSLDRIRDTGSHVLRLVLGPVIKPIEVSKLEVTGEHSLEQGKQVQKIPMELGARGLHGGFIHKPLHSIGHNENAISVADITERLDKETAAYRPNSRSHHPEYLFTHDTLYASTSSEPKTKK